MMAGRARAGAADATSGPDATQSSLAPWGFAMMGAAAFAIDPGGLGGVWLRGPAGAVRNAWLACLQRALDPARPFRNMPASIAGNRLIGGLDLAATLAAGRLIAEPGLLAEADGGVIVAAMAERIEPGIAAQIAAAMDSGLVRAERDGISQVRPARFGLVLCDEGEGDEAPPTTLTERCGLIIDLRAISPRDVVRPTLSERAVRQAQAKPARVSDQLVTGLCALGLKLGVGSMRAALLAVRLAAILAALEGRDAVEDQDAALAAAFALVPRATQLPEAEAEPQAPAPQEQQDAPPPPEAEAEENAAKGPVSPPDDMLLEAALANLPPGLLAEIAMRACKRGGAGGRSGQSDIARHRGRAIGSRRGDVARGGRLDLVATLRAAAPWQPLRRQEAGDASAAEGRIRIRRDDIRIQRLKNHQRSTTIFVVDASGSAALQRLAEAKGAVKLMLAESYVRRDEVAMIAFRSKSAEIVLPPTRALARAQRALSAMAGGGGTPIASGIDRAIELIGAVRRAGRTPLVVLLSDGRANVSRAGEGGREQAHADALAAGRALAETGTAALFIDTAAQPQERAREIAHAMAAGYLALPNADARRLAAALGGAKAGGANAARAAA